METGSTLSQKPEVSHENERTRTASFVFWWLLGLALIGLDQLTKYLAARTGLFRGLNALRPYIGEQNFRNFNFAFSLALPAPAMYGVYGAALALIAWHLVRQWTRLDYRAHWAWTLILAGAVSNIAERLALGSVRDFIYILTGIFNLADGMILLGIVLLVTQRSKAD